MDPVHPLTARIRQLVDLAHDGKVREASRLAGIPYPTLNDLYVGRTVNPNLATLESLRLPYGIEMSWLLSREEPKQLPRTGRLVFLPPHPSAEVKRRALREVVIPFVAWSMYEVFAVLEARLIAMPANAERPIVAEAGGDALVFRLATFLFQPLLAAEKAGETDVIRSVVGGQETEFEMMQRWIVTLRALGDMWRAALPDLLNDDGRSEGDGRGPSAQPG
ncbi:hypothetical protein ACFL3B_04065 [Gemmatimonadota bacterium]